MSRVSLPWKHICSKITKQLDLLQRVNLSDQLREKEKLTRFVISVS